MYREPLDYDSARLEALPRVFIDCTEPPYPTIDPIRTRVLETEGWEVAEIATGHFAIVTVPTLLVEHLSAFMDRHRRRT